VLAAGLGGAIAEQFPQPFPDAGVEAGASAPRWPGVVGVALLVVGGIVAIVRLGRRSAALAVRDDQ
jgi:hypothetical protein